ncbi:MAG: InlB B-repeat-containing protein [Anaerorhabdus sp.]|uniref:InlB B-repeat-containing protein n=2 Tax=Anaerorhabdus sp. TaxID=1872524 RepID=UPI002FCB5FE0
MMKSKLERLLKAVLAFVMAITLTSGFQGVNAEEGENPIIPSEDNSEIYYNVNFIYFENNIEVNLEQQVKAGEDAIAPIVDVREGYSFAGWDKDIKNITQDITITALYTKLEKYTITVNYLFSDGSLASEPYIYENSLNTPFSERITSPIVDGFVADKLFVDVNIDGSSNFVENVIYSGSNKKYTVRHLQEKIDGTGYDLIGSEDINGTVGLSTLAKAKDYEGFIAQPVNNYKLPSNEDTIIDIKYDRLSYVITFDTKGGTYIDPVTYKYGEAVATPINPTKFGYNFGGWSNLPITMPASDLTVTVNEWTQKDSASYSVVYWQQKVTLDGYDYVESYSNTGVVGTTINYQANTYEGFTLNTGKSSEQIKITNDGKAVKNVYYDRNVYTINFYLKSNGRWQENKDMRITAVFGADVSEKWLLNNKNYLWATGPNSIISYTLVMNMPSKSFDVYGKLKEGTGQVIYYGEKLNYVNETDRYYELSRLSNISFGYLTEEDKMPITGFTFDSWQKYPNNNGIAWLKYSRNTYRIDYRNVKNVESSNLKYEASMKNVNKQVTSQNIPDGIDNDYIFDGWYYSSDFAESTKVNWNENMPAKNLILYAKWKAPIYEVTFETNSSTVLDSLKVEKNTSISQMPENPQKDGYIFGGWYTNANLTNKYVEGQLIISNIKLYAKWISTEAKYTYKVNYVDENNATIAESDIFEGKANNIITVFTKAINGYLPITSHQVVNLNMNNKELTFVYKKVNEITYTINYVYIDENGKETNIIEPIKINSVNRAIVAICKSFQGYVIKSPSATVITYQNPTYKFIYEKINKVSYKVNHIKNTANGIQEIETETLYGNVGETVFGIPKTYAGYKAITSVQNLKGVVKSNGELSININYNLILSLKYYSDDNKNSTFIPNINDNNQYFEGNKVVVAGDNTHKLDGTLNYVLQGWTTKDVVNNSENLVNKLSELINIKNSEYFVSFGDTLTFENNDIELYAVWAPSNILDNYSIITSVIDKDGNSNMNGSITPSINDIFYGEDNKVINYSANSGYKITEILVDGVSVQTTNPSFYEFDNIIENHTVVIVVEKDLAQTKDIKYTVEHTINGTVQEVDDETITVWVNETEGTPNAIKVKTYVGYKVDQTSLDAVPTTVSENDVITINYVKDDTQTKEIEYTVEHTINGTVQEVDDETITVWVNETEGTPNAIKVKTYVGYKVDQTSLDAVPTTVSENDVITINYVKDDTQTKEIEYTVEHWQEGNSAASITTKYQETVWINALDELAVTAESIKPQTFSGFSYSGITPAVKANDLVKDNTVIKIYYSKNSTPVNPPSTPIPTPEPTPEVFIPIVPNPNPVNPQPEVVPDDNTPEVVPTAKPTTTPETITDESTPEVVGRSWALINLIASLIGVLLTIVLLFAKHEKEEENEENQEVKDEFERKRIYKVIGVIVAVVSIIVFLLTENITLPMKLVDKYTLLMIAFALGNIVCFYFGRKWHEVEDEEVEEQN